VKRLILSIMATAILAGAVFATVSTIMVLSFGTDAAYARLVASRGELLIFAMIGGAAWGYLRHDRQGVA
jgi:hypothetical protein